MQATPQIKQFSGFLNTDEVWLDIPEFEGIYQISTLFRVKALNRVVHTGRYGGFRTISERVCATFTYPNGYIGVKLYKKQKEYSCLLHRLIAAAFIPNPENKPCVNHKNGIKSDNEIENLEWCTYSENSNHAYSTGLQKGLKPEKSFFYGKKGKLSFGAKQIGGLNPNSKKIRCTTLNIAFNSSAEAARELGICASEISNVLNHKQTQVCGLNFIFI